MKLTTARVAALIAGVLGLTSAANASLITHTDSYGVNWTLSNDGINHGTVAAPIYDVIVLADTTAFSATGFNYSNAYINTVTILANASPISANTTGPNGSWTNVLGGQSSNGCSGSGAHFDCAYYTSGGNPISAPGVLMNFNGGSLTWDFALGFAANTTLDQALSFLTDGSHLKVDYYGYKTKTETVCTGHGQNKSCTDVQTQTYDFIGQISDNVTLNKVCLDCVVNPPAGGGNPIPEPETLALLGIGLLGIRASIKRKTQR